MLVKKRIYHFRGVLKRAETEEGTKAKINHLMAGLILFTINAANILNINTNGVYVYRGTRSFVYFQKERIY